MNEDIMLLSNSLVYDGMLKCGNEDVARRVLQIPERSGLVGAKMWVRDILSDRYKVVFCDTDRIPAVETKRGDRTTNEVEAALIKQVTLSRAFANCRRLIPFAEVLCPLPQSASCPSTDLNSNSSPTSSPPTIQTLKSTQQTDFKAATRKS
jgi:hypothetical protein